MTKQTAPTPELPPNQIIENKIMRKAIAALLDAGFVVTVNDSEEDTLVHSTDAKAIFAAMKTTDEDRLRAYSIKSDNGVDLDEPKYRGSIFFVYGNDGPDVICDYSVSLEEALAPVNEYADTLDAGIGL